MLLVGKVGTAASLERFQNGQAARPPFFMGGGMSEGRPKALIIGIVLASFKQDDLNSLGALLAGSA